MATATQNEIEDLEQVEDQPISEPVSEPVAITSSAAQSEVDEKKEFLDERTDIQRLQQPETIDTSGEEGLSRPELIEKRQSQGFQGLTFEEAKTLFEDDFTGLQQDPETGLFFVDKAALGRLSPEEQDALTQQQQRVQELQATADEINTQFDTFQQQLSADFQGQIQAIRGQFEAQRRRMEDINKRALAAQRTFGIRLGTARFAPGVAAGITFAEERAGAARIGELVALEQEAIARATSAFHQKKFDVMVQQVSIAQQMEDRIQEQFEKIRTAQEERNEKLQEEENRRTKELALANLISQGVGDPLELFARAQLQDVDVTIEDVTDAISALVPDEEDLTQSLQEFTQAKKKGFIPEDMDYFTFLDRKAGRGEEKATGDVGQFEQARERGLIPEGMSFFEFLRTRGVAERKPGTPTGAADPEFLGAILENPSLFNNLTPSVKTKLLPQLTQLGFKPLRQLSEKTATGFSDFDDVRGLINRMQSLLQQGVQTGPVAGIAGGIQRVIGAEDPQQQEFKDLSEDLFRTILKATSGVAASEREVTRLKSFLPKLEKQEQENRQNIKDFMRTLIETQFNSLNRLSAAGFDVTNQRSVFDNQLLQNASSVDFDSLATELQENEGLVINRKNGEVQAITAEEYNPELHLVIQ